MPTVILLVLSNIFMTFAWYGHLKYKSAPLWIAILASWGLAFFEYCLQVPANRWGHGQFTAPQLKVLQEAITLVIFAAVSATYLHEKLRWNDWVAFGLVFLAVLVSVVLGTEKSPPSHPDSAVSLSSAVSITDSGHDGN